MRYTYIDQKTAKNYSNAVYLEKHFGRDIARAFEKFLISVEVFETLHEFDINFKGKRLELLLNYKKYTWSIRLNDKYRLNFITNNSRKDECTSITIVKIHPHKY